MRILRVLPHRVEHFLPHEVGDIHLQLLRKVNKRSRLLSARSADVGGELVRRFVFIVWTLRGVRRRQL